MKTTKFFFSLFFIFINSLNVVSQAVEMDAGYLHSIFLCNDGYVWTGGSNITEQLGDSLSEGKVIPEPVIGLENIISVSAGSLSSFALTQNGSVWSWGGNSSGQLGLNSPFGVIQTPHLISSLNNVKKVSAGWFHTLFLLEDGTVWACGQNDSGQLGNDSGIQSNVPIQIAGLSNVIDIAAGYYHNLILKNDSTVWAWGYNYWGQLGDGTTDHSSQPVEVLNLSSIRSIAVGWSHNLALKNDGTVYAWGSNLFGQIGTGDVMNNSIHPTPVPVSFLTDIKSIKTEADFSMALKHDGTLWMFGRNDYGQLGNNSTLNSNIPITVPNIESINQIAAGMNFSLAMENNGTIWSWGRNSAGQLGDSTTIDRHTPVNLYLDCSLVLGTLEKNEESQRIQVAPNPCISASVITFDCLLNVKYTFYLYNGLGQLIYTLPGINDGKIYLERGNLKSGAYIFQIIGQDDFVGSGKIIIQ